MESRTVVQSCITPSRALARDNPRMSPPPDRSCNVAQSRRTSMAQRGGANASSSDCQNFLFPRGTSRRPALAAFAEAEDDPANGTLADPMDEPDSSGPKEVPAACLRSPSPTGIEEGTCCWTEDPRDDRSKDDRTESAANRPDRRRRYLLPGTASAPECLPLLPDGRSAIRRSKPTMVTASAYILCLTSLGRGGGVRNLRKSPWDAVTRSERSRPAARPLERGCRFVLGKLLR